MFTVLVAASLSLLVPLLLHPPIAGGREPGCATPPSTALMLAFGFGDK